MKNCEVWCHTYDLKENNRCGPVAASARSVDLYKKKQIKLNSRVAVGEVNMDEGHFLHFFAHLFFTSVSMYVMAIRVVEFSSGGYKIRKIFA